MAYQPAPTITESGVSKSNVTDESTQGLLKEMIEKLKINNAYLEQLIGERITEDDTER